MHTTTSSRHNWIRRKFECQQQSDISVSFKVAFCQTEGSNGKGDWIRLYERDQTKNTNQAIHIDLSGGSDFTEYETNPQPFNTNINNITNIHNAKTPGNFENCNDRTKFRYHNGTAVIGQITANTTFDVNFRIKLKEEWTEFALLFGIQIECIPL